LLLTTLLLDERLKVLNDLLELELLPPLLLPPQLPLLPTPLPSPLLLSSPLLFLLEQLELGNPDTLLLLSLSLLLDFLPVLPLPATPLCLAFCAAPPPTLIQPSN
jgi:hypothetical protein